MMPRSVSVDAHPEEPMTSLPLVHRPCFRARFVALLTVSCLMLVGVAGCKQGAIEIKKLLDDPGRYNGTTVRVGGKVTTAVGVLGYGAFRLDDGTGTVLVVSKKGAPREGAEVGVEGTFRSVFTFENQSGSAIEETNRYEP
jgi:hypothetical protein